LFNQGSRALRPKLAVDERRRRSRRRRHHRRRSAHRLATTCAGSSHHAHAAAALRDMAEEAIRRWRRAAARSALCLWSAKPHDEYALRPRSSNWTPNK